MKAIALSLVVSAMAVYLTACTDTNRTDDVTGTSSGAVNSEPQNSRDATPGTNTGSGSSSGTASPGATGTSPGGTSGSGTGSGTGR